METGGSHSTNSFHETMPKCLWAVQTCQLFFKWPVNTDGVLNRKSVISVALCSTHKIFDIHPPTTLSIHQFIQSFIYPSIYPSIHPPVTEPKQASVSEVDVSRVCLSIINASHVPADRTFLTLRLNPAKWAGWRCSVSPITCLMSWNRQSNYTGSVAYEWFNMR